MADRMHEAQEFVKKLNGDLAMAVAASVSSTLASPSNA